MQVPSAFNAMESRNNNMFNPRPPLPRPYGIEPTPSLPGFYITSEDDIKAKDVPMDGSISFFPYRDLSHIAIRQWNSTGNIECLTYVLDVPKDQDPPPQSEQAEPAPSAEQQIVTTLNSLNNGLAATFTTFADVLNGMRQDMAVISQRLNDLDGGRG